MAVKGYELRYYRSSIIMAPDVGYAKHVRSKFNYFSHKYGFKAKLGRIVKIPMVNTFEHFVQIIIGLNRRLWFSSLGFYYLCESMVTGHFGSRAAARLSSQYNINATYRYLNQLKKTLKDHLMKITTNEDDIKQISEKIETMTLHQCRTLDKTWHIQYKDVLS